MSRTETLPKELREAKKKNASKGTEMNPQITNTAMFVQQYSIDDICERTPDSEQPIYWDSAGSQTRCCTTLYVARCFIVLSCAVCNKDKVSATLWRLNELLKCESRVLLYLVIVWFVVLLRLRVFLFQVDKRVKASVSFNQSRSQLKVKT